MTNKYYYFISGLPDISFDDSKIQLNLKSFNEELMVNLDQDDYNLIKNFYYKYDNENVLNILEKKEAGFNRFGLFSQIEIEDEINRIKEEGESHKSVFPIYIQKFIENYLSESFDKTDVSKENQFTFAYYDYVIGQGNYFIKKYYQFELYLLNFLTASYSRKHKIEYEEQIIGEDEISQQIKKSNAKDFNLSGDFEFTGQLLQIIELDDIIEREKKVDNLRWNFIEDLVFFNYFTIEKIFAYLVKLEIVNRWLNIKKDDGVIEFNNILNNLQSSFEFPEEQLKK